MWPMRRTICREAAPNHEDALALSDQCSEIARPRVCWQHRVKRVKLLSYKSTSSLMTKDA